MRNSVCDQLGDGTATLAEVIDARSDPRVGGVQLLAVLESLPGASKVATRRLLAELGVDARCRLGELTGAEITAVLGGFGA